MALPQEAVPQLGGVAAGCSRLGEHSGQRPCQARQELALPRKVVPQLRATRFPFHQIGQLRAPQQETRQGEHVPLELAPLRVCAWQVMHVRHEQGDS